MAVWGGRDPALGFGFGVARLGRGFEDGDGDVASPAVGRVAMSSSPLGRGIEDGDGDVASPFGMGVP